MKLIACTSCHTQYDVAEMAPDSEFDCRCGASVRVVALKGEDASVQRCSACGALAREEDADCGYCGAAIVHIADRGSLICPECLACNADDGRFCLACGIAFEPVAFTAGQSEHACPCCERDMVMQIVGGIEIEECQKCHGIWAAEDRLAMLIDRMTTVVRDRAAAGEAPAPRLDGGNPADNRVVYRNCPVCQAHMNRRNFKKRSGVIVDECNQHGTWLDANELERIAGFVLSGRAEKVDRMNAAQESERVRENAREASRRVTLGDSYGQDASSIFGPRRDRSAASTVLDFLQSLLM